MKTPIIIQSKFLVTIITFGFAKAITLYPFILLKYKKDENNKVLINHESIHIAQQKELWILKFYWLYLKEYRKLKKLINNKREAYHAISFEKEANHYERNLKYLKNRKPFAWKKFKSKLIR